MNINTFWHFWLHFFRNGQYFDVYIAHIWIHWKNSGGKKEERNFTINTIYCTYFFAHNLLCVLYNIMPSIYWVPFFIPSMKTIWAMIVRTHNEATRRFIYKIGCWFSAAFDKWTITKYSTKKKHTTKRCWNIISSILLFCWIQKRKCEVILNRPTDFLPSSSLCWTDIFLEHHQQNGWPPRHRKRQAKPRP